jgi:hypothetical protein
MAVSLLIILPSTYHSPRTVKRKARVLTMGTVRLSSGGENQRVRSASLFQPHPPATVTAYVRKIGGHTDTRLAPSPVPPGSRQWGILLVGRSHASETHACRAGKSLPMPGWDPGLHGQRASMVPRQGRGKGVEGSTWRRGKTWPEDNDVCIPSRRSQNEREGKKTTARYVPACPMSRKNQTLPVRFSSRGTA